MTSAGSWRGSWRLGRTTAAGLLRDRAPPRRRAQRGTIGGCWGHAARRRTRTARRPRGRIAHVWLPTAAGLVSTLDRLDGGLTLFTGPDQAPWHAAAGRVSGPLPLAVRSLDAITARALGIRSSGALLSRPDGAAVGWWPDPSNATAVLRAAIASARAGSSHTPHQLSPLRSANAKSPGGSRDGLSRRRAMVRAQRAKADRHGARRAEASSPCPCA